jgi:DNA-binding NtrC family response regulator
MELIGKRLLIVDDEPLFLQTTCKLLQKEGAECQTAVDAASAMSQLEQHEFDLILTDLNMPGNLRWELLQAGRQRWSHVPMIVITGVPTLPSAIESLRLGVTDYLLKPIAFPELMASILRTLSTTGANTLAPPQIDDPLNLVGESPAMSEILSMVDRVAASSAHVLIAGETGTGKELIARNIHLRSRQSSGKFVTVDCHAIVEDQLAADLFGSIDAQGVAKPGFLKLADSGCLFLDEVAELPLNLQPKLLRVVQNQEFVPQGSSVAQRINVRFISSTQRNLTDEISAGRFRNDLYYRLGVLTINVPPLRDRGEDIILLAQHFLRQAERGDLQLSPEVHTTLLQYNWPGNVRQLRNVIVQAATFCSGPSIELEDLPVELTQLASARVKSAFSDKYAASASLNELDSSLQEKRVETERVYLLKLLEDSRGNVTHAAQKANMSRQGFHKLLKRHQISAADYR